MSRPDGSEMVQPSATVSGDVPPDPDAVNREITGDVGSPGTVVVVVAVPGAGAAVHAAASATDTAMTAAPSTLRTITLRVDGSPGRTASSR